MTALASRARGALLGLAVGDALGSTCEFNVWNTHPPYPKLATGITSPVGGGPFMLSPGQTTDDTQMAVALASSLFEVGEFRVIETAERYVRWLDAGPFDVGGQTRRALSLLSQIGRLEQDPRPLVRQVTSTVSSGNGGMMRAGAIAAWALLDGCSFGRMMDVAAWDCEITHPDPSAMLANVAYVTACYLAAVGPRVRGRDLLAATANEVTSWREGYRGGRAFEPYARDLVTEATRELVRTFEYSHDRKPRRAGGGGWCHTSLNLALWHLAHNTSYRDAVIDVANRGGDADTNAAIVGGLLGARFGDGAIPIGWLRTVLGFDPVRAPVLRTVAATYHVRRMLEYVGPLPKRLREVLTWTNR